MKRANIVSGFVMGSFGLLMLLVVIPAQIEPAPDGFVSPRLVPNITMILVVGLSILMVINTLRTGPDLQPDAVTFQRSELVALVKISAVFAVSLGSFLWVSPLVAGVALVSGTLLALGERNILVLVLMPAVLMFAVWLLFYRVLGTAIV